jgi:simple sugar transport system ATP-binding protein
MAGAGMGVVFISHKLNEVRAITNRLMIMRQGRVTATLDNEAGVTRRRLAELMCDCDIDPPPKPPQTSGPVLLALEGICTAGGMRPRLESVSLEVRAGEILGIAGVSGNGQRELADVVAGVLAPTAGRLAINGRVLEKLSPRRVQNLGVGRIPEDRMGTGLITSLPLSASMVLPRIHERRFSRFGILRHRAVARFVRQQIAAFDIRAGGPNVRTGNLSGGNLQKALLARELAWDPLILLAAQPTRGLDVAAAQFVHRQFMKLRANDRGLLVISEDLEELFALADRIAVMFEGRVMAVLPIAEATVRKVGMLMAGVRGAA